MKPCTNPWYPLIVSDQPLVTTQLWHSTFNSCGENLTAMTCVQLVAKPVLQLFAQCASVDPKFRRDSGLDSWFFAGCCLLPFLRAGEGLSAEHVAVCPGFAVRSAWFFQLKKFMLYAFSFWSALRLAFRHIADSRRLNCEAMGHR